MVNSFALLLPRPGLAGAGVNVLLWAHYRNNIISTKSSSTDYVVHVSPESFFVQSMHEIAGHLKQCFQKKKATEDRRASACLAAAYKYAHYILFEILLASGKACNINTVDV